MKLIAHDLLSRTEAAAYLGIKPQTLATWASTKRYPLPYFKIGRSVKYSRDTLERFVQQNRIETGSMA